MSAPEAETTRADVEDIDIEMVWGVQKQWTLEKLLKVSL